MLTQAQIRAEWAAHRCTGKGEVINFGGARLLVHPDTKQAWLAVAQICAKHKYVIRREVTGSYNCRKITGGTSYSLHSYPGVATDVNWDKNPYGRALVTDMPSKMVAEIKALVTNSGHRIFWWGGDFSGNKDAMHFEIRCTRKQLQSGVRGIGTLPSTTPPPVVTPRTWFGLGDKGENVRQWQRDLSDAGYVTAVDGAFGPHTLMQTERFQKHHNLTVDGKVGPKTLVAMHEYLRSLPAIKTLKVGVIYDPTAPVDEGYARQWGKIANLAVRPIDHFETIEQVFLIGKAVTTAKRTKYLRVRTVAGANRDLTAAKVKKELIEPYFKAGKPQLRTLEF
jgi:peptidoglycan hydrolase-like protein with peptidoglycan-binding domain